MFSTGPLQAPTPCLRCQLRQAILQLHGRPSLCRVRRERNTRLLTSTPRSLQDVEDGIYVDREKRHAKSQKEYGWKYPLGRIVGKPGRRQREGSARLQITAMEKPFEVVLMRDLPAAKKQFQDELAVRKGDFVNTKSASVSAAEIASEVLGEEPSQEDVQNLIDSLRPDSSILDRQQYDGLFQQLLENYSRQQLSHYLEKTLQLSRIEGDAVNVIPPNPVGPDGIPTSDWQPGQTPLEQRHKRGTTIKKSQIGKNKMKLVRQILRIAWSLRVSSEEQEIGELEVALKSWQVVYLFDLVSNGTVMYDSIIGSVLLRGASQIRPYRPDNIMRITARRQDAHDVAERIGQRLRTLQRLELDLRPFQSLLGNESRPGRPDILFQSSELAYVGQLTECAIEQHNGTSLNLFAKSKALVRQARRMLLLLLDLHTARKIKLRVLDTGAENTTNKGKGVPIPESAANLSFRLREQDLCRFAVPTPRASDPGKADDLMSSIDQRHSHDRIVSTAHEELATAAIIEQLTSYSPRYRRDVPVAQAYDQQASYWSSIYPNTSFWSAHLCKFLWPKGEKPGFRQRPPAIVQPYLPGLGTLLSYFTPSEVPNAPVSFDPRMASPRLVAHFLPSPFTNAITYPNPILPRIEIHYSLAAERASRDLSVKHDPAHHLEIIEMRALFHDEQIRVSVPTEACDLMFSRRMITKAKVDKVLNDERIAHFTRSVEESLAREDEALEGEPFLKVLLPPWLGTTKGKMTVNEDETADVPVDYVLERFEQVQSASLVPLPLTALRHILPPIHLRQALRDMPESLVLRHTEVVGGLVGGNRTETTLEYNEEKNYALDSSETAKSKVSSQNKARRGQLDIPRDVLRMTKDEVNASNKGLVYTALGLVKALTRINAEDLRALNALGTWKPQSSNANHI